MMKQLMRGARSRPHAGIYEVQSIPTTSGSEQQQPLRRQPQKAQQNASTRQKPSCLLAEDANRKKKKRRRVVTTTISNRLSAARNTVARELRIRWRLLSFYSRVAILVVVIPLFTLHIIFGTIDLFFHSFGPQQPPPMLLSYTTTYPVNSTTASRGRRNETSTSSFAVVINTYKRPGMLKAAVRHYADTCGRRIGVEQVFVVWAELDVTPPDPAWFFASSSSSRLGLKKTTTTTPDSDSSSKMNQAYVEIIQVPVDSLNSRFLPIANLSSPRTAIFMVDDDVIVDCFSLHQGFLAWKSSPESMVGYYPRLAAPSKPRTTRRSTTNIIITDNDNDNDSSDGDYSYVYHSWPMVYWRHEMNFVLTKAAFLHSRYLDLYSNHDDAIHHHHPREIKEYVDHHRNCEDVAMSMLIAHVTAMERQQQQQEQPQGERNTNNNENKKKTMPATPIYVQGRVTDHGLFHGISTGTGHFPQRSACLNDLTRIYRRQQEQQQQQYGSSWEHAAAPLDYQVPLRQASWVHPAPDFWWQYRPSNIFEWFAIQNIFQ